MKIANIVPAALLALSLTQAAGCIINSSSDNTVSDGVFHATWSLSDQAGPVSCAEVNADKADFLFTEASNSMGFDELFSCQALAGDSDPLPLDRYTYVASLLQCPDNQPGCPNSQTLGQSNP